MTDARSPRTAAGEPGRVTCPSCGQSALNSGIALLRAAMAPEAAAPDALREALPDDWRVQLEIIRDAVQTPANAEQITLLDLANKALRVLDAIEATLD